MQQHTIKYIFFLTAITVVSCEHYDVAPQKRKTCKKNDSLVTTKKDTLGIINQLLAKGISPVNVVSEHKT
jgi:hypothetical protein